MYFSSINKYLQAHDECGESGCFVRVIYYNLKPVLLMATVVSVILQCFTVFVATVAVWSLSWTVALRHYVPRYSTWVRRNVLWV